MKKWLLTELIDFRNESEDVKLWHKKENNLKIWFMSMRKASFSFHAQPIPDAGINQEIPIQNHISDYLSS